MSQIIGFMGKMTVVTAFFINYENIFRRRRHTHT